MEFSELYKQSGSLCRFSPSGLLLATAVAYRVVIRDAETLQILHLFQCTDSVNHVEWSPDSSLLCCANFKLGVIQVWSVVKEDWTGKIEEGVSGCVGVKWGADSRSLLSFSDFQLRITIWSLVTKEACYIQYPKYSDKGYCFRADGRYFALAERNDCKDFVSVYDVEDWSLLKRFPTDTTDLADIAWSPDGRYIAVWESILDYKILVYHPDGRLVASYSAYDAGLGIKSVTWSPSSQFLAVGSYDQKIRLLNHYTWRPIMEYSFPKEISDPKTTIFCEQDTTADNIPSAPWSQQPSQPRIGCMGNPIPISISTLSLMTLLLTTTLSLSPNPDTFTPAPLTLPALRPDPDKPNPRLGPSLLVFNSTGRYLASRNDAQPTILWIHVLHPVGTPDVVVKQLAAIRTVTWNPVAEGQVAVACGNGAVYIVQIGEDGSRAEAVEVPAVNFQVQSVKWNPDGKSLLLLDKDKFCMAFPVDDDGDPTGDEDDGQTQGVR
ncbi:WD repeat-containing protein wrap73 [Thoreauomyces humboldtii]|nr:WD repeat-containing protein wrap73 [Thoreauomyces humboldtii]